MKLLYHIFIEISTPFANFHAANAHKNSQKVKNGLGNCVLSNINFYSDVLPIIILNSLK